MVWGRRSRAVVVDRARIQGNRDALDGRNLVVLERQMAAGTVCVCEHSKRKAIAWEQSARKSTNGRNAKHRAYNAESSKMTGTRQGRARKGRGKQHARN